MSSAQGTIESVQFLSEVYLRRTTRTSGKRFGSIRLADREWRGWSISHARGAATVLIDDGKGRTYEVPRVNCVIVRAKEEGE